MAALQMCPFPPPPPPPPHWPGFPSRLPWQAAAVRATYALPSYSKTHASHAHGEQDGLERRFGDVCRFGPSPDLDDSGQGLGMGRRLGLDPALLTDIFNSSTAACWSSHTNNPCPVTPSPSPLCLSPPAMQRDSQRSTNLSAES